MKSCTRLISLLLAALLLGLAPALAVEANAADGVAINEENFPDAIFREYVSTNLDTDGDGALSDAEIEAVTSIDVSGDGISSLQGIEFFPT